MSVEFSEDMSAEPDWQRERDRFRDDTLAEVETLTLQRQQLERTVERINEEITSLIELSVRLGIETLPVADAPPIMVAICRAELARALLHVRRAGRCAVRMGIGTEDLAVALAAIMKTGQQLPRRAESP